MKKLKSRLKLVRKSKLKKKIRKKELDEKNEGAKSEPSQIIKATAPKLRGIKVTGEKIDFELNYKK